MSSTSTTTASAVPANVGDALDANSGNALHNSGISLNSFLASLAVAAAIFAIEFFLFVIIKNKFSRIYQPRTYLVPEKERTEAPPSNIGGWLVPVFRTSNSEFIEKCGLDAYFFLRYLRLLLKIFVGLALVILPTLIPINLIRGRGSRFAVGDNIKENNVTGLDQLSWVNVAPDKTHRYWAHLVLALFVLVYVGYTFFDELRGYIRVRQAYLTSPQHRLRASATTVLVSAIPRKWLSVEALDGLYDVFPGGIRNIWINRNFDELSEKVKLRNKLALALEAAETNLIKKAKKSKEKQDKTSKSKAERNEHAEAENAKAAEMAEGPGMSSGNPHQVRHHVHEEDEAADNEEAQPHGAPRIPIPIIGAGLQTVGNGVGRFAGNIVGGIRRAGQGVDDRLTYNQGFVGDEDGHLSSRDPDNVDGFGPGYRTQDIHPAYRTGSNDSTVRQSTSHDSPARHNARLDTRGQPAQNGSAVNDRDLGDVRKANSDTKKKSGWRPWQKKAKIDANKKERSKNGFDDDRRPLSQLSPSTPQDHFQSVPRHAQNGNAEKPTKAASLSKSTDNGETQYQSAYNDEFDEDAYGEPVWKKYLKVKDRDTMRLPIFGLGWMPSLPLVGKKVDTIYYCRKEVARLNVEIEEDQKHPENYPLMNSAFVQFNHQVAAHMACQAVSHHLPKQMAPRIVEISPDDVLWDNMSVRWWETYIRTVLVFAVVVGLIIGWAFPVTFTGLLSQLKALSNLYTWLNWIAKLPAWLISLLQGVLPQLILAILMAVLPMILRYLAKQQGVKTGMGVELSVQNYYFAFLFVQVFLVVSISSGITSVLKNLIKEPASVPSLLASNLPRASNYFFSYMLLQAFSVSAGALVQIGGLISWFLLAPIMDSTARQKWTRQTTLPNMKWGTFFPVYTNLAAIGLIYSVISPLILVFNIITFSLFWIVYRYNTLYVTKFRFDTGGLLFPKAINQLFTGLYVMELCLIGLFFLVRDDKGKVACTYQGIIMIIALAFTVVFQFLLNDAFGPLFRYLPITLEDDAVIRDEEFAHAQRQRLVLAENEQEGENIQDVLEDRERREREQDQQAEEIEMREIESRRQSHHRLGPISTKVGDWRRSRDFGHYPKRRPDDHGHAHPRARDHSSVVDVEAQAKAGHHLSLGTANKGISNALFANISDEIEDLSPSDRDRLIQRAFQHEALRAKRPVIWIPRDAAGVSDDEVYRTQRLSKHVWISNEYTGLDAKGRAVYRRSPPDFSEVDVIEL